MNRKEQLKFFSQPHNFKKHQLRLSITLSACVKKSPGGSFVPLILNKKEFRKKFFCKNTKITLHFSRIFNDLFLNLCSLEPIQTGDDECRVRMR